MVNREVFIKEKASLLSYQGFFHKPLLAPPLLRAGRDNCILGLGLGPSEIVPYLTEYL